MKLTFTTRFNDIWSVILNNVQDRFELNRFYELIAKKNNYFTVTLEPVKKQKTIEQLRLFHLLVNEYWKSGLSSLPNWQSIKDTMKYRYGAGFESLTFQLDKDLLTVSPDEGIQDGAVLSSWVLKSCGNYTIEQMKELIDGTIRDMIAIGVNSKRFDEIVREFRL